MTRSFVTTEDAARAGLDAGRPKPVWREGRDSLPLHELSPGEFEVFCFRLVNREYPRDDIELYGSSGDAGRDIVHRMATPPRCRRPTHSVQMLRQERRRLGRRPGPGEGLGERAFRGNP